MMDEQPSEAAKRKALCLAKRLADSRTPDFVGWWQYSQALALHLDEVDRVARHADGMIENSENYNAQDLIRSLMLPDPVDPLEEAWLALWPGDKYGTAIAKFRAELDKRGLTIIRGSRTSRHQQEAPDA